LNDSNVSKASKQKRRIEKANKKLSELFENDVKEFSINGARAFGHILAKRGIKDPQKWLENKMREGFTDSDQSPYMLDKSINLKAASDGTGAIRFKSIRGGGASKAIRAHELCHKIDQDSRNDGYAVERTGLLVFGSKDVYDKKLEQTYPINCEHGRALNEGVTNLLAEKLLGRKSALGVYYPLETFAALTLTKLVGEDAVFEAALFDPNILDTKLQERTGNKNAYMKIVLALDSCHRLVERSIRKAFEKIQIGSMILFSRKYREGRRIIAQNPLKEEIVLPPKEEIIKNHAQSVEEANRQSRRQLLHEIDVSKPQDIKHGVIKQSIIKLERGLKQFLLWFLC